MKIEIKTEAELIIGQQYKCLVVNASIGGHCYVRKLRYEGNNDKHIPMFSEQIFTVTSDNPCANTQFGGSWRKHDYEQHIVVGILPEKVIADKNMSLWDWRNTLKVKPITPAETDSDY